MPVLRAVPDTNVLVAAAISPRGSCGDLVEAAIDDDWCLVASPKLLEELEVVLHREKFRRWLSEAEAGQFITACGRRSGPTTDSTTRNKRSQG